MTSEVIRFLDVSTTLPFAFSQPSSPINPKTKHFKFQNFQKSSSFFKISHPLPHHSTDRSACAAASAYVGTKVRPSPYPSVEAFAKCMRVVYGDRRLQKRHLRRHGVDPRHRLRFWLHESGADIVSYSTYEPCMKLGALPHTQQTGLEGEISRDVPRTFVSHPFFSDANGQGQKLLFRILTALAIRYPQVGYCQGMNFVVAVMLVVAMEAMERDGARIASAKVKPAAEVELLVFSLMSAFLEKFDMRELWRPCVPQLKLRIFQFRRILSQKLPALQAHFHKIGLTADVFASQWFLTLLSYSLPLEVLVRVWDVLIMDGWKTIFRVGVAMLKLFEGKLLLMGLEELSQVFRHNKFKISADLLIEESFFRTKISTKSLSELEAEYAAKLLHERLHLHLDFPSNGTVSRVAKEEQRVVEKESDGLTRRIAREIRSLNAGPRKIDVVTLRSRIEAAEKQRAAAESVYKRVATAFEQIDKVRSVSRNDCDSMKIPLKFWCRSGRCSGRSCAS